MKRCPQCEFIYEDDQSLCDMDGVLLVFDSRTLPNPNALAPVTVVAAKAPRRNRAVPAFATVILALVLGMVYYVSMQRKPVANVEPPASAASTLSSVPETNPTPEAPVVAVETSSPSEPATEDEAKPTAAAKSSAVTSVKKSAAKAAATPQPAKSEEKKDDSKVGSILKKTGRILKKPFKF